MEKPKKIEVRNARSWKTEYLKLEKKYNDLLEERFNDFLARISPPDTSQKIGKNHFTNIIDDGQQTKSVGKEASVVPSNSEGEETKEVKETSSEVESSPPVHIEKPKEVTPNKEEEVTDEETSLNTEDADEEEGESELNLDNDDEEEETFECGECGSQNIQSLVCQDCGEDYNE